MKGKALRAAMLKLLEGKTTERICKSLCGELLGWGAHRNVYVFKQFPDYVIKIEKDPAKGDFANVGEWRNYMNLKDWKWFGPWLAPCEIINETGTVLIQRRVDQDRMRKEWPAKVPCLFTDLKVRNFGWIGDRFVCCDYTYILNMVIINKRSNMQTAKWWGSIKKQKV